MKSILGVCIPIVSLLLGPGLAHAATDSCAPLVGQWLDPASGNVLRSDQLFQRLSGAHIVLLGESHTTAADHRWQAYVLAALHARNSNMMVGFEMLPRTRQAVLDAWSGGSLGEKEFLEQSEWQEFWGYDARFYLPLLHFARMHRLPTLALNIDRELITRVGREGWHSLTSDQRMGLSDPAPASDAYRDSLARVYALKQSMRDDDALEHAEAEAADLQAIRDSDAFANFVDAQLTWDRAMAEVLAAAHRRDPEAVVVGIIGRGHLEHGYGIPSQLADLGISGVDVLLTRDVADDCRQLPVDLASAVFVVDSAGDDSPPVRPLLGVAIESAEQGVRVMQVGEGSVAEHAGLREGDLIQAAAGFETSTTTALIEIVQRQAPGTWLPLKVMRDGKVRDLVASFPQQFD